MHLKPIITYQKVPYYEMQVISDPALREAARLSWLNQQLPMSEAKIRDFLSSGHGSEAQGWLLYTKQHGVYYSGKGLFPAVRRVSWEVYQNQHWEAFLLSGLTWTGPAWDHALLFAEALCRDPMTPAAVLAVWADHRLTWAAEGLQQASIEGDGIEIRLLVSETDTPLQKELKGLGYWCEELLPGKLSRRMASRQIGSLRFSKLISLRSRSSMGVNFLMPKGAGKK